MYILKNPNIKNLFKFFKPVHVNQPKEPTEIVPIFIRHDNKQHFGKKNCHFGGEVSRGVKNGWIKLNYLYVRNYTALFLTALNIGHLWRMYLKEWIDVGHL